MFILQAKNNFETNYSKSCMYATNKKVCLGFDILLLSYK